MSDALNAATKYIATHRPASLAWGPFEGLGPDIVEDVRRIKSHNGPDLILSGSSTLTSTLLEHGLADEVVLIVYPVLLGQGKRLFSKGTPPRSFDYKRKGVRIPRRHIERNSADQKRRGAPRFARLYQKEQLNAFHDDIDP